MTISTKRLPQPLPLAMAKADHHRQPSLSSSMSSPLDNLVCSICFDILSFPVTLPCGCVTLVHSVCVCRSNVTNHHPLLFYDPRHNFDRGCILTAWTHGSSSSYRAALQQRGDLCPLCRQPTYIHSDHLQVNLLLKDLIASMHPAETQLAATPAKQHHPHVTLIPTSSPLAHGNALTTNTAASAFRRRPNLQTFSSFVYVCAASVTDPPGFVLAVLMLLILLAIAYSPEPSAASSTASAMVLFDTMDRVCHGLSLIFYPISMQMDQLDQVSLWVRLISYVL